MVTDMDFYYAMRDLLERAPQKLVKLLAVYAYALIRDTGLQPSLFAEENRKREVVRALDAIQDRFGDFIIHPARMINMEQKVLDRIAFGHV
jgi:DNA polymerase-4